MSKHHMPAELPKTHPLLRETQRGAKLLPITGSDHAKKTHHAEKPISKQTNVTNLKLEQQWIRLIQ
jgi:hypothetical protein